MIYNMRRRKKKLYKWLFNERMLIDRGKTFYAAFYSNGEKFSSIKVSKGWIRTMNYDSVRIYSYGDGNSKWHKGAAYRTVAFTEPPTGELLSFLQNLPRRYEKGEHMNLRNALRDIYIYISAEPCESGVGA